MTSLVSTLLNKKWVPLSAPGRVVRFGEESDPALKVGSIRKRVLYFLEISRMPMDIERITDAVGDKAFRVTQIVRRLVGEGLIQEVGSEYHQRYQLM